MAYTASLDLPVEYVQPGWLVQFGTEWFKVDRTSDYWHDCTDTGMCIALGFGPDVAAQMLGELLGSGDVVDADASEPDGAAMLHYHAGDTVQVRIPGVPEPVYGLPQLVRPEDLPAGCQIRVMPGPPDSGMAWVPSWGPPLAERPGTRWMTVVERIRVEGGPATAARLEDGTVLTLPHADGAIETRLPLEVAP
jgi:hypothetical protein